MDSVGIEMICEERLRGWLKWLVDEHATPMLLVGCGQDHATGKIVICVPDEKMFGRRAIKSILREAMRQL